MVATSSNTSKVLPASRSINRNSALASCSGGLYGVISFNVGNDQTKTFVASPPFAVVGQYRLTSYVATLPRCKGFHTYRNQNTGIESMFPMNKTTAQSAFLSFGTCSVLNK